MWITIFLWPYSNEFRLKQYHLPVRENLATRQKVRHTFEKYNSKSHKVLKLKIEKQKIIITYSSQPVILKWLISLQIFLFYDFLQICERCFVKKSCLWKIKLITQRTLESEYLLLFMHLAYFRIEDWCAQF